MTALLVVLVVLGIGIAALLGADVSVRRQAARDARAARERREAERAERRARRVRLGLDEEGW